MLLLNLLVLHFLCLQLTEPAGEDSGSNLCTVHQLSVLGANLINSWGQSPLPRAGGSGSVSDPRPSMERFKCFGFCFLPQTSFSLVIDGERRAADQTAPGRKLLEGTWGRQRQKLDERHCAAIVNSQTYIVKILRWSLVKAALGSGSLETYCVDGS